MIPTSLTVEVIDSTIDGKCSNCGECCTEFIPLTRHEVKKIKEYLKAHPTITNERHITPEGIHVLCPFRDNVNKCCKIYPVRPAVCRAFICNLSKDRLLENKAFFLERAHYNNLRMTNFITLHSLFFNDFEWELSILYTILNAKDSKDFKNKLNKSNVVIVRDKMITLEDE